MTRERYMMAPVMLAIGVGAIWTGASAAAPAAPPQSEATISIVKTGGTPRTDSRLDAARSSVGRWTVNFEDRSDSSRPYRTTVMLTPKQSAALVGMLKDARLYAEPEKITVPPGVECPDGTETITAIRFEGRRRKVVAICLDTDGVTKRISDLLFDSLPRRPCSTSHACLSVTTYLTSGKRR